MSKPEHIGNLIYTAYARIMKRCLLVEGRDIKEFYENSWRPAISKGLYTGFSPRKLRDVLKNDLELGYIVKQLEKDFLICS